MLQNHKFNIQQKRKKELIIFLWTLNRNETDTDDTGESVALGRKQLHNHTTYIYSSTLDLYLKGILTFSDNYHAD